MCSGKLAARRRGGAMAGCSRRLAALAVLVALLATFVAAAGASGTPSRAKRVRELRSLQIAPEVLPASGGPVRLEARLSGAHACTVVANRPVPRLPVRVPCRKTAWSRVLHLPADTSSTPARFVITVRAVGPKGAEVARVRLIEAAKNRPLIANVTARPAVLPAAGGPVKLSADVVQASSCIVTVAPRAAGRSIRRSCRNRAVRQWLRVSTNPTTSRRVVVVTLRAFDAHHRMVHASVRVVETALSRPQVVQPATPTPTVASATATTDSATPATSPPPPPTSPVSSPPPSPIPAAGSAGGGSAPSVGSGGGVVGGGPALGSGETGGGSGGGVAPVGGGASAPAGSPPGAPGVVSATGITATSATISWGPAVANGVTGVTYQVTGVPGCSPGDGTSCVATGLAPFTSYTACVVATDSFGTGPEACATSFTTPPVVEGSTLAAGQQLTVGEALVSSPAGYEAVLQADGNLVLYDTATDTEVWSTQTTGSGGTQLAMQTDGNLVLYTATGAPVWQSATSGTENHLAMQSDGNLVVYSSIGVPLWARLGGNTGGRANFLPSSDSLTGGETLYSPTGNYSLVMQTDGNLVEYTSAGAPVWSTSTGGAGNWLAMQGDGNLVVYSSSNVPLWDSGTAGNPGAVLAMQGDGNVVVYGNGNVPLWSSEGGLLGGGASVGQKILAAAMAERDQPYCYGGGNTSGPTHGYGNTDGATQCGSSSTVGFDCTGLTLYAVYQATGIVLPHDGSQAAYALAHGGQLISNPSDLQPGDIVYFGGTLDNFVHAGVYAGGGSMWDANIELPPYPDGVQERTLAWETGGSGGLAFVGAVRFP